MSRAEVSVDRPPASPASTGTSFVRSFFAHGSVYAVGIAVSQGIAFLLFPFFSRVLTPSDYGIIDLIGLLMTLINVLLADPISEALGRYYVETRDLEDQRSFASTALVWSIGLYTVCIALGLIFVRPLTKFVLGPTVHPDVMVVGLLAIWCSGIMFVTQGLLRWRLLPRAFTVVTVTTATSVTAASAILVLGFDIGVIGAIAGQFIGFGIGAAFAFWLSRELYRFRFDRARLKRMLTYGLPLIPASAGAFLNAYVDRIAIRVRLSLADVGVYGAGYRLSIITSLALLGFQGALTPLVLSRYEHRDTPVALARIFRLFCAIALAVFLGVSVFADEALRILVPPAYYGAAEVVPLVVAGAFLAGMVIFAPGLKIAKRTGLVGLVIAVCGVINAVLAFVLVEPMGIKGPALAFLVGSAGSFVGLMMLSQRFYPVPHNWVRLMIPTLAVVGLVAVAREFLGGTITAGTLAAKLILTVAGGVIILFGLLDPAERDALGRLPLLARQGLHSARRRDRSPQRETPI
jgi:O-antigen/teichoic acid export membrane protein